MPSAPASSARLTPTHKTFHRSRRASYNRHPRHAKFSGRFAPSALRRRGLPRRIGHRGSLGTRSRKRRSSHKPGSHALSNSRCALPSPVRFRNTWRHPIPVAARRPLPHWSESWFVPDPVPGLSDALRYLACCLFQALTTLDPSLLAAKSAPKVRRSAPRFPSPDGH